MSIVNYIGALLLMVLALRVRRPLVRQALMLAASYAFYLTWGPLFLAVLVGSSIFNFIVGEVLRRRRTVGPLCLGLCGNLMLLGLFKYLPALSPGLTLPGLGRLLMPVGLSFWTFQALSYLFDIYREEELDPSLMEFCLYMAFWPTVVMGPICRLSRMLPQFRERQPVSRANLVVGLRRIGIGLFMKLIVAQLLGASLDASQIGGGGSISDWGGLDVWFVAIGFGFQLFFDFAGYSHIVIGAAQLFGIGLEENFDSPFLATTPSLFWTKWHMSLSSWIRDYVFMPLATQRREVWWRYATLVFSMFLFGLWHGATVTFALWGVYHGIFLVMHRVVQQHRGRFRPMLDAFGDSTAWLLTFLGISLSWILFRSRDLAESGSMFAAVFSPATYFRMTLSADYYRTVLAVAVIYLGYASLAKNRTIQAKWLNIVRNTSNPSLPDSLVRVFWENRLWWLAPMIATVVLFAGAAALLESSHVTTFIYTLF